MDSSIVFGINAVLAALKSNQPIEKLFVSAEGRKNRFHLILKKAKEKKIDVHFVPVAVLTRKAGLQKHQGVLAVLSEINTWRLDDLLHTCQTSQEPPLLVLLDGIEDPHNLGAIIRSAEAAGFTGMIIQNRHCAPLSPTVHKSSAGALSYFPIARVKNLAQTIDRLKDNGFWIIGSDDEASESFWEIEADVPIVVVIGNEGRGIRRLVKEKCDILVQIPMFGQTESLNASVAAALLFYEIKRKRADLPVKK